MTADAASGKRPYARVNSIRTVVRDGWYNAWTDLIWWKEYVWLSHGMLRSCSKIHSRLSILQRQRNLLPQSFKLSDESARCPLGVLPVEEVAAQPA